jgi:hypothetical protein
LLRSNCHLSEPDAGLCVTVHLPNCRLNSYVSLERSTIEHNPSYLHLVPFPVRLHRGDRRRPGSAPWNLWRAIRPAAPSAPKVVPHPSSSPARGPSARFGFSIDEESPCLEPTDSQLKSGKREAEVLFGSLCLDYGQTAPYRLSSGQNRSGGGGGLLTCCRPLGRNNHSSRKGLFASTENRTCR